MQVPNTLIDDHFTISHRLSTQREVNESDEDVRSNSISPTPRRLLDEQRQRSRAIRASIRSELRKRQAIAAAATALASTARSGNPTDAATAVLMNSSINSLSSINQPIKSSEDQENKKRVRDRLVYLPSLAFRIN
jgi:hypothetical protein